MPVDLIKIRVQISQKATRIDRHLKKARGKNSRNIVVTAAKIFDDVSI